MVGRMWRGTGEFDPEAEKKQEMLRQILAQQLKSMSPAQAIQANRPNILNPQTETYQPMQGPMPTDITPPGQTGPTPVPGSVAGAPAASGGGFNFGALAQAIPAIQSLAGGKGNKSSSIPARQDAMPVPGADQMRDSTIGGPIDSQNLNQPPIWRRRRQNNEFLQ